MGHFVPKYAIHRAGGIGGTGKVLAGKGIGLGVTNPGAGEVESVTGIVPRVERVLEFSPK